MVCKIAPKLSSPTHRGSNGHTVEADTQVREIADYETAIDCAGYGRFSKSALGACAWAFFSTGVENSMMSYVLPAARCDLDLTTYHSGLVNMAFMSGGTASAFLWGIVGDVYGRRNTLCLTLFINSIVTLAQSFFTDYRQIIAARCLNGFLIGGPSTLVFTYLSDLVGAKTRQFYLSITGMCFVAAWLIMPAIAWLLIPIKSAYATILPIYSWRLFLAVGCIPSLTAGIWIRCLPESPRLLLDTNRDDQALDLLKRIHRANCGNKEVYKVKKLIQDPQLAPKYIGEEQSRTKTLLIGVLRDLKMFVSKAYAFKSSLILIAFFANMAAGFGLNLWIPELLRRMQFRSCNEEALMAESAKLVANDTSNILAHSAFTNTMAMANVTSYEPISTGTECKSELNDEIFISNLVVGAVCVIGNIACALLVARGGAIGVRRASIVCTFACAMACVVLALCACSCIISNQQVIVAAAAGLNAASLNGNVLLIRLLLFALPPKLSGLGVCWGAWWGRAGGVASNLAVGVMLDYSCSAPFIVVSALLLISIGAILMISLNPEEKEHESRSKPLESAEKPSSMDRYISTHM